MAPNRFLQAGSVARAWAEKRSLDDYRKSAEKKRGQQFR
jgi:hypothetical protein